MRTVRFATNFGRYMQNSKSFACIGEVKDFTIYQGKETDKFKTSFARHGLTDGRSPSELIGVLSYEIMYHRP